jgi:outer membrane biosynthesis protein TonB
MHYYNPFLKEKRNRSKSMSTSVFVHGLLLLIAFLYSFKVEVKDPDPDKPYKVTVDFRELKESSLSTYANADVGEKRPKTEEIELLAPTKPMEVIQEEVKIEIPKVTIPTPTPTPPVTSKTVVDESPVTVVQSDIEIEKPSVEKVPEVVKETPKPNPTTPAPPTPAEPKSSGGAVVSNTPSTSSGTNTNPASTSNGTGSGKGNTGSGQGSSSGSDNTSGSGQRLDGSGAYDGTGESIFGRKPTFKNYKEVPMEKNGFVSVKICIDKKGKVGYAEIIERESTIKDRDLLKRILKAAYGYVYEPDASAPTQQCGKLNFKLNNSMLNSLRPR